MRLPSPAEMDMMLRHIDPDCDRATWIKVGAALRREGYDLLLMGELVSPRPEI